jgi:hypothetical protein
MAWLLEFDPVQTVRTYRFSVSFEITGHECCREGPVHTPCANHDDLVHTFPLWPATLRRSMNQGATTISSIWMLLFSL